MELQDLIRELQSASTEEWPFQVLGAAERLNTEMGSPQTLLETAARIADVAVRLDCHSVVGASRMGDELAGAVVATSSNGLRLFSTAEPSESVLIIEGLMATGAQTLRAVQSAKEAGANRAGVVAVLANRIALKECEGITEGRVVALEEF